MVDNQINTRAVLDDLSAKVQAVKEKRLLSDWWALEYQAPQDLKEEANSINLEYMRDWIDYVGYAFEGHSMDEWHSFLLDSCVEYMAMALKAVNDLIENVEVEPV